jgi:hypothetical protein
MTVKPPPLPEIPKEASASMRSFLTAMRLRVARLVGLSGQPMSRAVTFNDLVAMGLSTEDAARARAEEVQ